MDYRSYLGKEVSIVIDRPLGSVHPSHSDIRYKVNYGYIPHTMADDGEEIDVYLLGVSVPVRDFTARVIAVIRRFNDCESKLVAAPVGLSFTKDEVKSLTDFQEQYFETEITMWEDGDG